VYVIGSKDPLLSPVILSKGSPLPPVILSKGPQGPRRRIWAGAHPPTKRLPACHRAFRSGTLLTMTCPFCDIPEADRVIDTDDVIGLFDLYPVTPGHLLLVTRRHVATWFEADERERSALIAAIDDAVDVIEATLRRRPDGYNIGFNAGAAAGQTVTHLHLHVIPRFQGDMDDPRGGIRGAIPHRRIYPTEEDS
jgi:diadenosine tetraphosphate (Ap4A) HIT family hydrolase